MPEVVSRERINSFFIPIHVNHFQNLEVVHVAIRNLETHESKRVCIQHNIEHSPTLSLKNKTIIFLQTLKQNQDRVLNIVLLTAAAVAAIGLGILMTKFFSWHLDNYYKNILNGTAWISDQFFVRKANIGDWYVEAVQLYLLSFGLTAFGVFVPTVNALDQANLIKKSFQHNKDVKKVTVERAVYEIDIDPAELANEINADGDFLDPISNAIIPRDQINRPCFIKFGNQLYTLKSLINIFLKNDLEFGSLKHPIYDRYLFENEQKELLETLSMNLGISPQDFLKGFNLFNDPHFKVIMTAEEKTHHEAFRLNALKDHLLRTNQLYRVMNPRDKETYLEQNKKIEFHALKIQKLVEKFDFRIAHLLDL